MLTYISLSVWLRDLKGVTPVTECACHLFHKQRKFEYYTLLQLMHPFTNAVLHHSISTVL